MIIYDYEKEVETTKTFEEVLAEFGKTEKDIERIYHGLDHNCRCGCGGRYFEAGERGFTRAVNQMKKAEFRAFEIEGKVDGKVHWLNIPEQWTNDMCYCIYFKVPTLVAVK